MKLAVIGIGNVGGTLGRLGQNRARRYIRRP
jgi:hypothetical protein